LQFGGYFDIWLYQEKNERKNVICTKCTKNTMLFLYLWKKIHKLSLNYCHLL
jgi:hypothetical protein